jgi:hypothetical protein
MIDKEQRYDLLEAYANRPGQNGIFAVRNTKTGEVWVGASRNLDAQKDGLWMRLSDKMLYEKDIQASWNKHGKGKFSYAILERIIETDPAMIERALPERAAVWRAQLNAGVIKGA